MKGAVSESAKQVLAIAADEARGMNHGYVGTEHLLLGLMARDSSETAGVLASLGLNSQTVRDEIERLAPRGQQMVYSKELPLTPRAKRVLRFASEEIACVTLSQVLPEDLLIGLVRELDGVAGQVMRNLGLQLERVRSAVLKIRMEQIRIVERAVRPVRAGIAQKRKMREELLGHLTAIYQEERLAGRDVAAAMEAAAARFGDPAQLARELQFAVPASARKRYRLERWWGWRAPESVVQMMARTSVIMFISLIALMGVPLLGGILIEGWDEKKVIGVRMFAAMAVLMPATQFGVGVCYYKMRDSLWGVFGARRSIFRALLWGILAGVVSVMAGLGIICSIVGMLVPMGQSLPWRVLCVMLIATTLLLFVRLRGAMEIRDTVWETVDLGSD